MAFPEAWLSKQIEAATGCRAYPAYVPGRERLPFVAFTRDSTERERWLEDAAAVPVASFSINVYAAGYFEAKTLADKLRIGVDNFAGVGEGCNITATRIIAEADGPPEFDQGEDAPVAYVVGMTVEIRFREET